jgi:hypothetical protein
MTWNQEANKTNKPDVALLQETWESEAKIRPPKVDGYFTVSRARTIAFGGPAEDIHGVASANPNPRGLRYQCSSCQLHAWCFDRQNNRNFTTKIQWNSGTFFVHNIYRPPIRPTPGDTRTQQFVAESTLGPCLDLDRWTYPDVIFVELYFTIYSSGSGSSAPWMFDLPTLIGFCF